MGGLTRERVNVDERERKVNRGGAVGEKKAQRQRILTAVADSGPPETEGGESAALGVLRRWCGVGKPGT